jgi:hypothetical protein
VCAGPSKLAVGGVVFGLRLVVEVDPAVPVVCDSPYRNLVFLNTMKKPEAFLNLADGDSKVPSPGRGPLILRASNWKPEVRPLSNWKERGALLP